MKSFLKGLLLFPLAVLACLHLACDGKNGPMGPAGQSVTILVTPTPSVPAHTFLGAWSGSGTAPGQYSFPSGIFVDGAGNIYVGDTGNNRVQEIFSAGNGYVLWSGPATGTLPGQFNEAWGVALDASGDLWVADWANNRVEELPVGTGAWTTIGGTATGTGPGQFYNPPYLAFDGAGNLYVSDWQNNRIQELPAGMAATVSANWVTIGDTSGTSGPGQFSNPSGLAADGAGDLYVADTGNNRIQELPAGKAATVAANWVTLGDTSGTSGPGQFNNPYGLGTDPAGDLYVADTYNDRIQELPAGKSGAVTANWVTFGSTGSGPGQFNRPYDVKTDSAGNVYVADTTNNRIEKFSP